MPCQWWRLRGPASLLLAALSAAPAAFAAAEPSILPVPVAAAELPDAPGFQQASGNAVPAKSSAHGQSGQTPSSGGANTTPAGGYDLKKAEHQRILGVMPEFNAVNHPEDLPPLTPKQKFGLMWKSSTDGFIFALDAIVAGIGQAKDSNPGYGQGAQGYFKRFGASYADTFDGNFWGNAVLTSALDEDPRYFREGEDYSPLHRALYSAATAVWCRRDSGTWGPNYANVLGNLISGGISNLYYPAADRGSGQDLYRCVDGHRGRNDRLGTDRVLA